MVLCRFHPGNHGRVVQEGQKSGPDIGLHFFPDSKESHHFRLHTFTPLPGHSIPRPSNLRIMPITELILPVIAFLIGLAIMYAYFRLRIGILEEKGRTDLERWKLEHEDRIRKDSVNRSRFTLKGKISEQLAPLLPEFPFEPSDARFIGSPIDFVVFDGYTKAKDDQGDAVRVVLVEVKRGKNTKLTRGETLVKRAVEAGRVSWMTVVLGDEAGTGPEPE